MEIAGFPNYTISNKGEIYSKAKKIIMKQHINNDGGYFRICLSNNGMQTFLFVHRLVYQAYNLKSGEPMPEMVDHENGIKTDNSKDNLRKATRAENSRNRGKNKNNKSGHKDIRITPYGTFQVKIQYIKIYYKSFKTLAEAIAHRDIKLRELHGEFANNGNQTVDEIIAGSTVSTTSAEVLNLL